MTIKGFMKTYEGFDWKNGTVVFVNGSTPYIAEGAWKIVFDKYLENLYKEIYEEGIKEALDDEFNMETFVNYAVMRVNNYNISAELDKKS